MHTCMYVYVTRDIIRVCIYIYIYIYIYAKRKRERKLIMMSIFECYNNELLSNIWS